MIEANSPNQPHFHSAEYISIIRYGEWDCTELWSLSLQNNHISFWILDSVLTRVQRWMSRLNRDLETQYWKTGGIVLGKFYSVSLDKHMHPEIDNKFHFELVISVNVMFSLLVATSTENRKVAWIKKTASTTVTVFNAVRLVSMFAVLFYIYNEKCAQ